ncbi:bifunctional hydroxymethylpyrimidine kinase/phosphomethylpyrimidine kinase [uncultured Bifidobacterium sp.]|uniref:bifunctional hydroxymethylpyrimidine kinase/phosphomethylpyrimidine kinase n=1 Tax=uncultured Bifidobacterium sp. TaxID=165187 RepID=UPI00261A160E|nr:bifunctional hydroxymethylpyrimidine kinase/phosphomethylpyrimidine kinase [uncultured Bifidobacterium sp.]
MTTTLAPVLSIAGSDSSGGAGIQADLKTMLANGVFGMTAIAALTAQNTTGVTMVTNTPPDMLAAQIDAVFSDIPPVAVKIGMVSSAELINVIADRLTFHHAANVVLDPVMVATSGAKLIEDDAIAALTSKLFPLATVITPNMPETQVLCDLAVRQGAAPLAYENGEGISTPSDMVKAGHLLADHFGCAVLVKGGHGTQDASDVLVEPSGEATWFRSRRIDNPNTHGTGCTLSSAIASHLALGEDLPTAVDSAKHYLTGALKAQLDLGHGSGPMDHAWKWR